MPRFSLPDASGLTPLEFPFNPSRPFRSFGNDLPQPAPESIARFQAAMAEPPAEPDVPSTPSDGSAPITDVGRTDRIYDVPCTVLPDAESCQADAEIRVERQDIGQPTTDRQVQQTTVSTPTQAPTVEALERTSAHLVGSRVPRDRPRAEHVSIPGLEIASIDVPTQARTIDQPNLLPATYDPTVKRQDDIGGTIPIVTTKVEHVTTSVEHVTTKVEHVETTPAGVARPEAAPHQADTVIRVERQYIEQPEQPTANRQVQQTTTNMRIQAPTADVPAQTPTIDEPTQPPTVEALEGTSAHLVGSRVPRDRPRAEHASIPGLETASVDVPAQTRTIDQPNPLPATDNPTVKRQDDIGGAIPIVTTKVEHVTTSRQVRQTTDDNPASQAANDVPPTLQAAPVVVPAMPDVAPTAIADIISIEIDPAAATAKTRELVEAAEQVADAILVTPSLVRGDGEITIRLKPTVLDGSEISMKAKGTDISVIIVPATPSVAHIVEQSKVQFEQMLAERLPTFQVAVSVQAVKTASKRKDSAA